MKIVKNASEQIVCQKTTIKAAKPDWTTIHHSTMGEERRDSCMMEVVWLGLVHIVWESAMDLSVHRFVNANGQ
jgi:hypothetical protein